MKFKDLPVGSRWIVKDGWGNTAVVEKINKSRSPRRENTKVIKGRYEHACGVFDGWYTRPSKDISPIKK